MDGTDSQDQYKPTGTPPPADSASSISNKSRRKNDIVGRTSFTLPSMSGFWSSPPSQGPAESLAQPLPQKPMEPPGAIPPPQLTDKKTESQESQPITHPGKLRLRPLALILLLAILILIFGTLAYQILAPAGGLFSAGNGVHPNSATRPTNGGGNTNNALKTPANSATQGGQTNESAMSANRSFQVGEHPLLLVKGHGNNVNIHAGSAGTIIVTAQYHNSGSTPADAAILYTQGNDGQGHDQISVMTNPGYTGIDYDVTVPGTARVQVEEDAGSIDVYGVNGVTIDTGSGNLGVEDVHGPVDVHTVSGDITARGITGQMTLGTENGTIRATGVTGSLQAITHNGDVVVRTGALYGPSTLETTSGSVRFTGSIDPQGFYQAKTTSGDIDLTLPSTAAFQLAATTSSGSIRNDFGGTVVGNAPRAQITANTTYGSVIINKLA